MGSSRKRGDHLFRGWGWGAAFLVLPVDRFRLIVGGGVVGALGVLGAAWIYITERPTAVENMSALLASRSFNQGATFDARKTSTSPLGSTHGPRPHARIGTPTTLAHFCAQLVHVPTILLFRRSPIVFESG